MSPQHRLVSNIRHILLATLGACAFWSMLGLQIQRPAPGPHPGLKDDALKEALRKDHDHDPMSYLGARKALFGEIDGNGREAECAYTGDTIEYFMQPLPDDGLMEHAWSVTRLPAEARTDLHHLFAVTSEARVARVNLHYGAVVVPVWSRGGSRSGPSKRVVPVFEVRKERRGDIARAMFYVATMYELKIPGAEEQELRRWHDQDPVSKEERRRNDAVAKKQRSRNPFVDHPNLTNRIKDF